MVRLQGRRPREHSHAHDAIVPLKPSLQPTECPDQDERAQEELRKAREGQHPINFDCAPCVEPQFWAFRKAEILVAGRDFGDPYI